MFRMDFQHTSDFNVRRFQLHCWRSFARWLHGALRKMSKIKNLSRHSRLESFSPIGDWWMEVQKSSPLIYQRENAATLRGLTGVDFYSKGTITTSHSNLCRNKNGCWTVVFDFSIYHDVWCWNRWQNILLATFVFLCICCLPTINNLVWLQTNPSEL